MKNILIQLAHPAHFHYYKNTIKSLKSNGHKVHILIKSKDMLERLLIDGGFEYSNILKNVHRQNKLTALWDMLVRDWKIFKYTRKHKINLLTGSTSEVAHIGWLLNIPSINVGEDDAAVVPIYEKCTSPFLEVRLTPTTCDNRSMEPKCVKYPGYMELGYLHPNHFTPDKSVVEKYFSADEPYFILRFAKLNAHHDAGIQGINTEIAQSLIDILKPQGRIYITSERELEPQFEQYRIKINPLDMHHVMAFASLYIGDSQTMAAEAAVLGTPFVRFNDFVGRIGYLRELEDDYQLGYGIKASEEGSVERLCNAVSELANLSFAERKERYQTRRQKMLSEKIDYAKFLTWFIENYPASKNESMKGGNEFWERFR